MNRKKRELSKRKQSGIQMLNVLVIFVSKRILSFQEVSKCAFTGPVLKTLELDKHFMVTTEKSHSVVLTKTQRFLPSHTLQSLSTPFPLLIYSRDERKVSLVKGSDCVTTPLFPVYVFKQK